MRPTPSCSARRWPPTCATPSDKIIALHGHVTATRLTIVALVLISAAATFITQRAVIANQTTPAEGQAAMIQKLMQVGIPISVLFSGVFFPLGVLLYWFTSNIWTMLQQFYIFRYHPHTPGAPVARDHRRRDGEGAGAQGRSEAGTSEGQPARRIEWCRQPGRCG